MSERLIFTLVSTDWPGGQYRLGQGAYMLFLPIGYIPARTSHGRRHNAGFPLPAQALRREGAWPPDRAPFSCAPPLDGHVPAIVWPCSRPFCAACLDRQSGVTPPVERGAGIVDEESASVSSCWRGGSRQYSRGESRPVINSLNSPEGAGRLSLPGVHCLKGGAGGGGRRCRIPSMPGGHRLDLVITLSSFGQEWRRLVAP
jgi:hypothetical protein